MGSEEAASYQMHSVAMKLTPTADTSPVTKFAISLRRDDDVDDDDDERDYYYRPGDTLSGDVVLVLSSPIRVSSIVVELRGEATVACRSDDGAERRKSNTTSTSQQRHSDVVSGRQRRRQSCSRRYYNIILFFETA